MSTEANQTDDGRAQCSPCRGTGRVISSLGGETREVTCPWCGGTGKFTPGRDAQESRAEETKP